MIKINNSRCSFSIVEDLKRFPNKGIELKIGTNFFDSRVFSAISPPIIAVFPSTTVTIEQFPEKEGVSIKYDIDKERTDKVITKIISDFNQGN